jgi:hypothetical protein
MAKQTFSVGQTLTAAQMTSLQQTAMSGGAASAKTASYTLVAADAGTAISMSNASATTITVNTALFAAGDTVHITNLGAGVCTITAGTATVNSSASLALAQYESGFLDFTSTSAAIFIKGAGAAAAGGTSWTLLNSGGTALTGAQTITVSGISAKNKILVIVDGASSVSNQAYIYLRLNTDTGNNYNWWGNYIITASSYSVDNLIGTAALSTDGIHIGRTSTNDLSVVNGYVLLDACNTTGVKTFNLSGGGTAAAGNNQRVYNLGGYYNSASTISSISIFSNTGNLDAGTVYVYTSA